MNITIPDNELRPLIEAIVVETVEKLRADGQLRVYGKLAVLEPEAAALLGCKSTVLRDCRLRGEITATKVGGRYAYEIAELERYLAANRQD